MKRVATQYIARRSSRSKPGAGRRAARAAEGGGMQKEGEEASGRGAQKARI